MKKFLSILTAAVLTATLAFTASANTTLLTGTPGGGSANNGSLPLADQAGKTLQIVITCTEASAQAGWGVGGLCPEGSWSVGEGSAYEVVLDADPVIGNQITLTYNVDEVVAALGSTPNANFYNGFEVVSAEVVDAAPVTDDTPSDTGAVAPIAVVAVLAVVAGAVVVSSKKRA